MKILLAIILAMHVLSFLLYVFHKARAATLLFFCASFGSMSLLGVDWSRAGQPPFASMHHVMLALSCCALPAWGIFVALRKMQWSAPVFPGAAALPTMLAMVFERSETWTLAPALQSAWFVPHVLAYMVSYSLALTAFLFLAVGWFRAGPYDGSRLETGSYELLSIAFPLMTFGMMSGALWANQVWGDYWSWDAKETWSLITWTLYLCYFHCRKERPLRRYAHLAHALAFSALLTTFLLVNLLPKLASKLHSYV